MARKIRVTTDPKSSGKADKPASQSFPDTPAGRQEAQKWALKQGVFLKKIKHEL